MVICIFPSLNAGSKAKCLIKVKKNIKPRQKLEIVKQNYVKISFFIGISDVLLVIGRDAPILVLDIGAKKYNIRDLFQMLNIEPIPV